VLHEVLVLVWAIVAPVPSRPDGDTITTARRGDISLVWDADPAACPTADEVIDDALAAVGQAPPAGLAITAHGEVTRDGEALALVLTIRSPHGEGTRRVVAPQCRSLGRIAALVLALTIDPSAALPPEPAPPPEPDPNSRPEPEPEPKPAPAPATTPEPDPTSPREPDPTPQPQPSKATRTPTAGRAPTRDRSRSIDRSRTAPLHGSVVVGAGLGAFALPRPTAAFELGLAIAGTQWRAELAAHYWAPSERASSRNATIGGSFQLVGATARGCWVPRWRTIEVPLCALASASAMLGRGTGALASTEDAASPFVAAGGGPTLAWRPRRSSGRVALLLRVEGTGALTRPAFQTQPSGVVWKARGGALLALGGVEVRFASRP
jgi:hypothetical protein